MAESLTEANDLELATNGLAAYKSGDYTMAIKFFSELKTRDPDLWECRLYLAMAYGQVAKVGSALKEFRAIAESCPEADVREKALGALRAMNHQSHDRLKARDKGKWV